jgi:hypothetical protein
MFLVFKEDFYKVLLMTVYEVWFLYQHVQHSRTITVVLVPDIVDYPIGASSRKIENTGFIRYNVDMLSHVSERAQVLRVDLQLKNNNSAWN